MKTSNSVKPLNAKLSNAAPSGGVEAHTLETPDSEGRWLACHANGEWHEYDVLLVEDGWVAKHVLSTLKQWHPIEWMALNGWGRWQAVAACSSTSGSARLAFENWITSPPYERDADRWPADEERHAWPGQYRDIAVQLAWEAWQAVQNVCEGVNVNGIRCTEPSTTKVRVIGYQCQPYSETWQTIGVCASCAEKIAPTPPEFQTNNHKSK